MAKILTTADRKLLLEISKSKREEARERAHVEQKIAELRATSGAVQRAATNALVARAFHVHGIAKSIIADIGLGAPGNRHEVYDRLQETGIPESAPGDGDLVEGLTIVRIPEGDGTVSSIRVDLESFQQDDLGTEPITGHVVFDEEGDVLDSELQPELDPLTLTKLWGLPEVQVQL